MFWVVPKTDFLTDEVNNMHNFSLLFGGGGGGGGIWTHGISTCRKSGLNLPIPQSFSYSPGSILGLKSCLAV